MQDDRYEKRIRIFTTVYTVVAVMALVLLVSAIVSLLVLNHALQPEFTYHGNDTVSGWATIFSMIGYLGGIFGKALLGLLILILALLAAYWIVGLVLNFVLRKRSAGGETTKGVGTALGIWTVIPGAMSLYDLATGVVNKTAELGDVLRDLPAAALFLGGGIFLLVTLHGKEDE